MARTGLSIGKVIACVALGVALNGLVADTANAATQPTAVTGPASSVTLTASTLTGNIDPNGASATWSFEYGTTTTYGLTTSSTSAGSGTGAIAVSRRISGLTPGTTYHYRLVATNSAGTAFGKDVTFGTPERPPTVTKTSVSVVHDASAGVAALVDPNGLATTWYVAYGTSTAYGSVSASHYAGSGIKDVSISATLSALTPDTTYHFALVATNAAGTTKSVDETLHTTGPPTIAASSAIVMFHRPVNLSGMVSTGAANEGVAVYARPINSSSFILLATVLTRSGGAWSDPVRPKIQTTYEVLWRGEASSQLTIRVRPFVTLALSSRGRFVSHVAAGRSFAGHVLRLQRLTRGTWQTVAALRLNRQSNALFRPRLPTGRSRLRAFLTTFQAGMGYLGSLSVDRFYTRG